MGSVLVNYIHVLRMRLKHVLQHGDEFGHTKLTDGQTGEITNKVSAMSLSNGHIAHKAAEHQESEEE